MNRFFTAIILFFVVSCAKIQTHPDTDKVQVRIENTTGFTLESAKVADINYGDVTNHRLTDYKILNEPIYSGYCIFNVGGIQIGAGVGICGTPMPPPFEPGYYTFKVMPAVDGYNPLIIIKQ